MKLAASSNHKSFNGQRFDGFANGLSDGSVGRGRLCSGAGSAGDRGMIPEDTFTSPPGKKHGAENRLEDSTDPKKRKQKFEAGMSTKKFEAMVSDYESLKKKLQGVPESIAASRCVLDKNADDRVFQNFKEILDTRETVFKLVSMEKPDKVGNSERSTNMISTRSVGVEFSTGESSPPLQGNKPDTRQHNKNTTQ